MDLRSFVFVDLFLDAFSVQMGDWLSLQSQFFVAKQLFQIASCGPRHRTHFGVFLSTFGSEVSCIFYKAGVLLSVSS